MNRKGEIFYFNFVVSPENLSARLLTREVSICGGGKTWRRRMRFATRPVGSTPSPTVYLRFAPSFNGPLREPCRLSCRGCGFCSDTHRFSLSLSRIFVDPLDRVGQVGMIGAEIFRYLLDSISTLWNPLEWM